jgi:hypothetical protein
MYQLNEALSLSKFIRMVIHGRFCMVQASILAESGSSTANIASNGHPKNGIVQAAGYTNAAFMGSANSLSSTSTMLNRPNPSR